MTLSVVVVDDSLTVRMDLQEAFEEAGVQRLMLQDFIPRDLDHVRLMGRLGT